ncbi:polysaccharide deacetylase family protein [Streptomyces sp. NBC_01317]|uniref:polysaccharide deacetylase family protein n=1 Tax=Streptomyces sp. NBC_01317 TaxID=2903822 RepID=UPI002E0E9E84|nr:polysaccharide deacetylase family protein [Streptomyces sp. NBC_01317]
MKKEEMIPGRRALLRLAACLGAAVTTRVFFPGEARAPGASAAPVAAAGPPAAGPPAGVARNPAAYRLRPMTDDAPSGLRTPPPVREKPFRELPQVGHAVVLTFDDGPDPRYTPDILGTLRAHDVRAMFFVCGEMASYHRDLLRRMAADGHVVGNHTWSHPQLPQLTRSAIRKEMERTSELIEDTVGAPPVWFRAPYGAWNRDSFEIGAELGMEPLAWTVDTLDWTTPGTDKIVKAVRDGAGPGVVVLSHDAGGNREQSVAALRRYLPELIAEGYGVGVPHP